MDKIINNGIPHVLELIFESINTPGLVICLDVSQTWRELAKKILIKRWKGKIKPGPACRKGQIRIVRLVLERCNTVFKMTTVITSGIPNVGEIIFEDTRTDAAFGGWCEACGAALSSLRPLLRRP